MGFHTGSFATVWSVQPGQGNFTKVRISIDRKNKQTNQWEQDFSGFCTFVGAAHAEAGKLREKDRIKLGETDVTSRYDKTKRQEYINYTVFSFEMADKARQGTAASAQPKAVESNPVEGDDQAMPF